MGGSHPKLQEVIDHLAESRMAALVCDESWKLVWVSDELKVLIGEEDETKLGYGRHMVQCWMDNTWRKEIKKESQIELGMSNFPYIAWDTDGGVDQIASWVSPLYGEQVADAIRTIEPQPPPPLWRNTMEFIQGDLPPVEISQFHISLYDRDGYIGNAVLYDSTLPARLVALLLRGDEEMFERMANLYEPGRRPAAVLFGDLEASTMLARRLSSAAYFHLIRALTTAMDDAVVAHGGIVGKHAGDGVVAFFLTSDRGGDSGAARAAIEAARDMARSVAEIPANLELEIGGMKGIECRINVGVHWGPALYMGQLVTGGRLEVTALGDEVNECARILQSAAGGQVLASKVLVEQLAPDDASLLEIDPDLLRYQMVEELPGATDKAVRDAGGIPVTTL